LVKYFLWEKSNRNAEITADGNSGYYAIHCLIVFLFDINKGVIEFSFLNIILWILMIVPLVIMVRYFYYKFQGVGTNKSDDDFA